MSFERIADSSSGVHPAQQIDSAYDHSAQIDLAPNQQITVTKTYPNMGPVGRYRLKAKYLPGIRTTESRAMPNRPIGGATPASYIEVINEVALHIDVYDQTQTLLYAPTRINTKNIKAIHTDAAMETLALKPTLPRTGSKVAGLLHRIDTLQNHLMISGGAYKLGIRAYSSGGALREPVVYTWKMDPDTPSQQVQTGNPAEFTLQVGKPEGPYTYTHQLEVTAIDPTGISVKDTFNIALPRPEASIAANYNDLRNEIGKSEEIPHVSASTAYRKLVIVAQTEGTFDPCDYTWHPITTPDGAKHHPKILDDGSKALYNWPLTGDPNDFDSYQAQEIKVEITDQIGQTISVRQTIENPKTQTEELLDKGDLPDLKVQFEDSRDWITTNRNPSTWVTNVAVHTPDMTIKTTPTIQVTRQTYGQKTPTITKPSKTAPTRPAVTRQTLQITQRTPTTTAKRKTTIPP